jgi:hypothetical protein
LIADLVLLAADKTIEIGLSTTFRRYQSLGCRAFTFRPFVHVARDPGCYRRAPEFLAPLANQYGFALVVFDREGSGTEDERIAIEQSVEERLSACGWTGRSACVVVDPEVENWFWSDSPHVAAAIRWPIGEDLRGWMNARDLWPVGHDKPPRPKEALEAVLRVRGTPRSSSIYGAVAEKVSLSRCTDPAFTKLRQTLSAWFPSA